jgi:hypothetical protein
MLSEYDCEGNGNVGGFFRSTVDCLVCGFAWGSALSTYRGLSSLRICMGIRFFGVP